MNKFRPGNDIPTDTPPTSWRVYVWLAIGVVCVLLIGSTL